MPTTRRLRLSMRVVNTLAPDPAKSQTLNRFAGAHQVTSGGRLPHASCLASAPAPRNAQRTAPVRRSNPITELKWAPAGKHDSLQPPGWLARHAVTPAGCVYN